MKQIKNLINFVLAKFNLALIQKRKLDSYVVAENDQHDLQLLKAMPIEHSEKLLKLLDRSQSQLRQDLFVLSKFNFKKNGFFVEFGATNGVTLSNTYLLEKEFDWKGVLSEPARCWRANLEKNRSAAKEFDCVWSSTGQKLLFNEVDYAELSTIESYSNGDRHFFERRRGSKYEVSTISLADMLRKNNAPRDIEYLSIDTEGSEYEILSAFPFSEFTIRVITVEHNFTENRAKIHALLTSNGYVRVHENISKFDDWYILE